MTPQEIFEGNKVIADFLEVESVAKVIHGEKKLFMAYYEDFELNYRDDMNILILAARKYRDTVKVADVHSVRVYDAWHGMIIKQIFEALVNAIKARTNELDT